MAFHFSLDVVLRVRQGLERQQELLLREANRHLMTLEQQVEELNTSLLAAARQELQQLAAGLSAAELHFDLLCRSALLERRCVLEKDAVKARAARDIQAASFRQARQQREVIETLRQRQFGIYRQLEARKHQREVDDLFLLRRDRRQCS